MSAQNALYQLYQRHAPRWIKVIRWREMSKRIIEHQRNTYCWFYGPMLGVIFLYPDQFLINIFLKGPNTQEDLLLIKQNVLSETNNYHRNWEYGEFEHNDRAPLYDLSRRRLNYPEHYEGRYKDVKKTVWGEILEVKPRVAKRD